MPSFSAPLWRWPTPNGVLLVTVPEAVRPPALAAFGRTPVVATVNGKTWKTSIFASSSHGAILLVPKKVARPWVEGDELEVRFEVDLERAMLLG